MNLPCFRLLQLRRSRMRSGVPAVLCLLPTLLPWVAQAQTRLVLNDGPSIAVIAGSGQDGKSTAGSALASAMGNPAGLAYSPDGSVVVADARNNQVVRITADGSLSTLAGTGIEGFAGDGGPAAAAEFNRPTALAFDSTGNLWVADTGNRRIRRVSAAGVVTTVAGGGEGAACTQAAKAADICLRAPSGVAVGSSGEVYIADTGNHRLLRLSSAGTVSTFAGSTSEGDEGDGGSALSAQFRSPAALLLRKDGVLLVADRGARRIRAIETDGTIHAVAVGGLRRPEGLAADAAGLLLISDADAQTLLASGTEGTAVIAGDDTSLRGQLPAFDSPSGVASDAAGNTVLSDRRNHRVLRIALPVVDFGTVPTGQASATQTLTLQNAGTAGGTVTSIDLPAGVNVVPGGGDCGALPIAIPAAASCTLRLSFTPAAAGTLSAIAQVHRTGAPPTLLRLTAITTTGGTLSPSAIALRSDGSISYAGTAVRLSATVTGSLATPPTGNVDFTDGTVLLGTSALQSGVAGLTTSAMQPGSHALRAVYSGDARYAGSTSAALQQTVAAAPDFTLTASASSYTGKASGTITVPLTLLPINGTLNRVVSLAVSGLPAGSTSTFSPPTFTIASDPVAVTLTATMPATLSSLRHTSPLFALLAVWPLLLLSPRRFKQGAAACTVLLCISGCGGGFRTSGSSPTQTASARNYTAIITATTVGVTGDTLVHTATVQFAVTP